MTSKLGRKTHFKKYLAYNRKWQFFPVAKINGKPKPELVIIEGKPRRGTSGTFHPQWRENGVPGAADDQRRNLPLLRQPVDGEYHR